MEKLVEKKKRPRAVNFTELEVRFLVDIAIKYINIIENKQTDAVTWKDKNQGWVDIATEFSAVTGFNRGAKVLRLKYDGIKRNIKSKMSKNKLEIFKTGGGTAQTNPLTDYEEKLMGYISLSVEGLPTENDSDNVCPVENRMQEDYEEPDILGRVIAEYTVDNATGQLFHQEIEEVPSITVEEHNSGAEASTSSKWNKWNPKQLKEKKHSALLTTPRKQVNKDSLNKKIDLLTDSRSELLKLQTQVAEQDVRQKQHFSELQKKFLENEEDRQSQQHNQLMVNLQLQHQLILDAKERQKRESTLTEELLHLEIQKKKLEILIKQKQLE